MINPQKLQCPPLHITPPLSPRTRGGSISAFSKTFMTASRGFRSGNPLDLTEWQRCLLEHMFEEKDDGLLRFRKYLVGMPRKNGKSLLGSTIALYALVFSEPGTQIYSAARNRDQAKIVFEEAKSQVLRSATLMKYIKPFRDRLENRENGAIYRAISADANSAQGLGPSITICDELHAWRDTGAGEELWAALTEGSGDRPESLLIGISTAGASEDTLLGRLFQQGVRTTENFGEPEDPTFGMAWWAAEESDDISSYDTWAKANPNLSEGLMDIEDLRSSFASALEAGNTGSFERYRLNRWVRANGQISFLSRSLINKRLSPDDTPIPLGARITAGFDGSTLSDATGIIIIDEETGRIELFAGWEKPQNGEGWVVPRDEVNAKIAEMFENYNVRALYCDSAFWQAETVEWSKQYRGKVKNIPQSARMIGYASNFKKDLVTYRLSIQRNERLIAHFSNAIEDSRGHVMKESKMSRKKIDFLVAAILANQARVDLSAKPKASGKGRAKSSRNKRILLNP